MSPIRSVLDYDHLFYMESRTFTKSLMDLMWMSQFGHGLTTFLTYFYNVT